MNASYREGQRRIRARRAANRKACISTHVAKVTTNEKDAIAVTAALRTRAKKLREAGSLGKVQTRVCRVAPGVVGPKYRYTAAQVAEIAEGYRPRKDAYKAARAALIGA